MNATDEDRSGSEGGAERLLRALRGAAEDLGAAEALSGLGEKARGLVEEVSRAAAASRSAASGAEAGAAAATSAPPDVERRLVELRACVDEVADLLDAGLERLEALEMQFGDPESGVEQRLAEGIARCERTLGGVEHRLGLLDRREGTPARDGSARATRSVLLLCGVATRRAGLALDLEREGLHVLAAPDLALAIRCVRGRRVDAVLLLEEDPGAVADALACLEEAPGLSGCPVAVLGGRTHADGRGDAFLPAGTSPAAIAASLTRLADAATCRDGDDALPEDPSGAAGATLEQGPHAQSD